MSSLNEVREFFLKCSESLQHIYCSLLHLQRARHASEAGTRLVDHGVLNLPEERSEHRNDLKFGANPVTRALQ